MFSNSSKHLSIVPGIYWGSDELHNGYENPFDLVLRIDCDPITKSYRKYLLNGLKDDLYSKGLKTSFRRNIYLKCGVIPLDSVPIVEHELYGEQIHPKDKTCYYSEMFRFSSADTKVPLLDLVLQDTGHAVPGKQKTFPCTIFLRPSSFLLYFRHVFDAIRCLEQKRLYNTFSTIEKLPYSAIPAIKSFKNIKYYELAEIKKFRYEKADDDLKTISDSEYGGFLNEIKRPARDVILADAKNLSTKECHNLYVAKRLAHEILHIIRNLRIKQLEFDAFIVIKELIAKHLIYSQSLPLNTIAKLEEFNSKQTDDNHASRYKKICNSLVDAQNLKYKQVSEAFAVLENFGIKPKDFNKFSHIIVEWLESGRHNWEIRDYENYYKEKVGNETHNHFFYLCREFINAMDVLLNKFPPQSNINYTQAHPLNQSYQSIRLT